MYDLNQAFHAQLSVIGSMLLDERCVPLVLDQLRPEDFSDGTCRATFTAIRKLFGQGRPIDPITVVDAMRGGERYVVWARDAMTLTTTAANVGEYIPIVRRAARRRTILELADKLAEADDDELEALVRKMSSALSAAERMPRMTGPERSSDFCGRMKNKDKPKYVVTFTYDEAHLPPDKREADKCLQKVFRKLRMARRRRKEELRYVYVTEGWHGKSEDAYFGGDGRLEDRRLHHHVVLNGCGPGDLEEISSLWQYGGYVRIEPVEVHYYRELAKYLTKEAREFGRAKPGERTWRASRNLKKYEVEYIEIPSDSVTLSAPPGAVDYVQFSERNPFGFADCVGARYLLFEDAPPPAYSYTRGRRKE